MIFKWIFITSVVVVVNVQCLTLSLKRKDSNRDEKEEQPVVYKPPNFVDIASLTESEQPHVYSTKIRQNLPECATQQVCNAIFVRMNHTQQLCDCSRNYEWECSAEPTADDGHTIELTRRYDKMVYTQIKLCEPMMSVRTCKTPTDWTLLAMQSERTGKAHYVVVCRCPEWATLEGPYTHNHPPYARIPGIRVYGMLCSQANRLSKQKLETDDDNESTDYPEFPWDHAYAILNSTALSQLFSL